MIYLKIKIISNRKNKINIRKNKGKTNSKHIININSIIIIKSLKYS